MFVHAVGLEILVCLQYKQVTVHATILAVFDDVAHHAVSLPVITKQSSLCPYFLISAFTSPFTLLII